MLRSLNKIALKVKTASRVLEDKDVFTVIIIILVAFSSFGLGRVSSIDSTKVPIFVENGASLAPKSLDVEVNAADSSTPAEISNNTEIFAGKYVASRNGTKYHYPWCSGAQRIKDENKVWFESTEAAKKAGYQPASNCKGL